jgi:uracil-DNA glycosylase
MCLGVERLEPGDLKNLFAGAEANGWKAPADFPNENDINISSPNGFFPAKTDIFRAFEEITPEKVRHLVLGMDPYPDPIKGTTIPYATGLAFDVPDGCEDIPSSLNAIVNNIQNGVTKPSEKIEVFRSWIKNNGVLMLNSALTVRRGESGSHLEIWEEFTINVCANLISINKGVKLYALGAHARKILCKVLESAGVFVSCNHPSIAHVGGDRSFAKRFRLL